MSAVNVLVDAVSWITPVKQSGSPTKWHSHSIIRISSSVAAGEVRHNIACALIAAAAKSPRMPAGVDDVLK